MSWRQRILIGFAVLCVVVAACVVYISMRVNEFVVEQGASGAFLAARQAARLNDSESAGAYYAQALMARPSDQTLQREALKAHILAGQMPQAVSLARASLAQDEQGGQPRLLLAVAAIKRADYATALEHLNEVRKGPFTELLAPNIRLWVALAREDEEARSQAIRKLSRSGVFAAVPLVQAAHALELSGQVNEARASYERALQSGGVRYVFMILAYGDFLQRHGEAQKAEKLYDYYDERNLPHPHVAAARARLNENRPRDLDDDPVRGLAGAYAAMAEAMNGEQRTELALGFFRLAQYLDGNNDLVSFNVGKRLGELKRFTRAAETFGNINKDALMYDAAQIERAQMLFEAGAAGAAIVVLRAAQKKQPDNRDFLISLGDLYRAEKRFAEAEAVYDTAITLSGEPQPRHWFLYFARGMMRERLNNWDMAEIDLQRARELSDDEPNVLNYLGYSWIDQGIHLDEGLRIIRMAVKKEPKNGAFVDSLGWAYYKLGDYDNALKFLEVASRLEATDPVITDHLGDALWRAGREVEARYQWRKALAFEPIDKDRDAIEKKLLTGLGPPEKKNPKAHMPRGGTAI